MCLTLIVTAPTAVFEGLSYHFPTNSSNHLGPLYKPILFHFGSVREKTIVFSLPVRADVPMCNDMDAYDSVTA